MGKCLEVFSYHHVNGQSAEKLLPAILITTMHPQKFKELNEFNYHRRDWQPRGHAENPHERIILIPIRKTCKNETDVSDLN